MPIVTVNVSTQVAPTPSTLQQTGVLISEGGTVTAQNKLSLLTQLSDLTPLLTGAAAITSMVRSGSTVTVTTTNPHNILVGDTISATIAGVSPAGYNGTFQITATGANTFTYTVTGTPGSVTVQGVWTPADVAELLSMATTFFSQGSNATVQVLELGDLDPTDAIGVLSAWLIANPQTVYVILVPREWDNNAALLALIAQYESPNSLLYFIVTTTPGTQGAYTALMKDVLAEVEDAQQDIYPTNALTAISWSGGQVTATTTTAHGVNVGDLIQIAGCAPTGYNGFFTAVTGTTASTLVYNLASNPGAATTIGSLVASQVQSAGVPSTEFSAAATLYDIVSQVPSSTNRLPPLGFRFQFGVTPWPLQGNNALLASLELANVNYVSTGAEGGISNAILKNGILKDGNQFNYWYATDWVNINGHLALANEVINGSNTNINPLYLNQDGINRLQARLIQTLKSAIEFGMVVGTVATTQMDGPTLAAALATGQFAGQAVVNAVPFPSYYTSSPGDYKIGRYAGLSAIFIPQNGFQHILVNLVATNIITL